jgi:hypothetical protein
MRTHSNRREAFATVLRAELDRVGRAGVSIDLDDSFAVTLRDRDGQWRGSAPAAFGALVGCAATQGEGPSFWQLFRRNR